MLCVGLCLERLLLVNKRCDLIAWFLSEIVAVVVLFCCRFRFLILLSVLQSVVWCFSHSNTDAVSLGRLSGIEKLLSEQSW